MKRAAAVSLFLSLATVARAQNPPPIVSELHAFPRICKNCPFGWSPGQLIQSGDGSLYGTTTYGGHDGMGCDSSGRFTCFGSLFKLTVDGTFTLLFSFNYDPGTRTYPAGAAPKAPLAEDKNGDLYGVTQVGLTQSNGTIFKASKSGSVQTLYAFCQLVNCADGNMPYTGLVQGADEDFYGTTQYGGAHDQGVVFKISRAGVYTVLHSFNYYSDGSKPTGLGLILGSKDRFFGTTSTGGANGYGTAFSLAPDGRLTTLHSFGTGSGDGLTPVGGLVKASDGNLYGTTFHGGANFAGTVFEISPSGEYRKIYDFTGAEGSSPASTLLEASDGNLWGTSLYGGNSNNGTVFAITTSGALVHSVSFDRGDGCQPTAGLIQGDDGKLYGSAENCGVFTNGKSAYGTIFAIDAWLPPPKLAEVTIRGSYANGRKQFTVTP